MTMQKVLHLTEKQGSFLVADAPKRTPGSGQVLIKVHAAGLNPIDLGMQQAGRFLVKYPAILGLDVAGVVEQVGKDVTRLKKGDRVFALSAFSPPDFDDSTNTYQQYCLALGRIVGIIPDNISFDQAASLPCTFNAAFTGFYAVQPHGFELTPPYLPDGVGKYAGQPIVILGGASSLGQYAIQLARISGFSPIITTASKKHEELLTSLGATHVVDRSLDDDRVVSTVQTVLGPQTLEYICDSINREPTQSLALKLLPQGGHIVTSHIAQALKTTFESRTDVKVANTLAFVNTPYNKVLYETLYQDALPKWLENGTIKPNRVEVLPDGLAGIPTGLQRFATGDVSGVKLVARPQETA